MKGLFRFNRRRWVVFGVILTVIYLLVYFGVWGIMIPFLGAPLFIAALMLLFVPSVLFSWTGFFEFAEFGMKSATWEGHAVIVVFYACVALLLSWPFGRVRPAKPE
ncbi:MAG: hypothetical protein V3S40_01495 [Kiloniellales bacterium]